MTRPALQAVPESGELPAGALSYADLLRKVEEQDDKIAGYQRTVERQARAIGGLERRLKTEEAENEVSRPVAGKITALIEKCHRGTGHPKRKASTDRVKLVKARLKDQYDFDTLDLAVEGLIANPFSSYGKPKPTGTPAQRDDELSTALKSGEAVEKYANLGAIARKA